MSEYPNCPDCGAAFGERPFNRDGWYYVPACGQRWHRQHGWAGFAPEPCLRRQLAQERAENEGLRADSHFWSEEAGFLRRELTKINNIIQPLWGDLRVLREEAGRDPQTGEAAQAHQDNETDT